MPRIIITPGEPAGIGPDIVLAAAQKAWPAECIVICDPEVLTSRAEVLKIPIQLELADLNKPAEDHKPGVLKIIPVKLKSPCKPGELNPDNATYVITCLTMATDYCLQGKADALVTGPIQKSIINAAGIPFMGHTEFLAARAKVSDVLMLFVVDSVKVALVTTHIPLSDVPKAVTHDAIISKAELLYRELKTRFGIANPKILVAGLNPHAGENGYLGREEIETIEPALHLLRAKNIDILGPLPADTLFTEKQLTSADAVLAMYHDQALPVVKYMGFNHAVNVTLGLPFIRTSVDHGTALDIAGTNKADAGSMMHAIQLAVQLSKRKKI